MALPTDLPDEFEVALADAIAAPEAFGASFDALPAAEELELGAGLEGDPAIAFRKTLGMFATGVTILTARAGDSVHGMTANAFMSVSLRPPLVLVSIDRRARMNDLLHAGMRLGVSVLEAGQAALSDHFAGRPGAEGIEPRFELVHDTPLVEGALAHLATRVVRSYWGGDHSLFLAQVVYAYYGEGEPLLFHGGRYERLVRDLRVFSALPQKFLEPILALGVEREYGRGDVLMRRGEPGAELMLIVEGAVRVERPGRSLALGVGEIVGEIEVLDPQGRRIADVTALEPTRCLVVTRDTLLAALERNPRAAIGLLEVLASRFRETA
ncbi:MAG: flavin reductase [Thermoleophilia bacterium]|nr:flavin reductase [Gaiellaceae bacterium]MDW8337599.1 flavin reductase [Thermoleophilia bacterium]